MGKASMTDTEPPENDSILTTAMALHNCGLLFVSKRNIVILICYSDTMGLMFQSGSTIYRPNIH